jgi:hypothetical protein
VLHIVGNHCGVFAESMCCDQQIHVTEVPQL